MDVQEELEGRMTCDEEDLERLGFIDGAALYPHHAWENLSTPVLASAVSVMMSVVVVMMVMIVVLVVMPAYHYHYYYCLEFW